MTTHQHQGATDVSPPSSWPSAGPATAPAGDAADGAMTPAGAITVGGAIVIFVAISTSLLSLQYWFDVWDRESHGAWPRDRRRRRGDDGTAGSNSGGVRSRGVDPELLRALPVTVYRAAALGSKEDAVECSVCLAELQDGEEARFLPQCGHGFHAECVDMWLASHTTCPLCRLTVSKLDPVSSRTPTSPALAFRPLPPEPANPPTSVLVGVTIQGVVTAANVASDDGDDTGASASTTAAAALVIEIPELAPVPTPTPRDMAKSSPVFARPRSFRRLWSFGRQGPTSSSCCTCAGAGEVADVEQGVCVTVGVAVAEAEEQLPPETTAGAAQGSAV